MRQPAEPAPSEPAPDCPLCPRLVGFRAEWRAKEAGWHNAPVPTWSAAGDTHVVLLVVGLAPGLRGANRTGRPFTGDYAGDLLYATLCKFGFAKGDYRADPTDGLTLAGAAITNAVRCVPPQNKPTGPEIRACRPFLTATLARFASASAVLALGRIAHDTVLDGLGLKRKDHPFGHGAVHDVGTGRRLYDSYHCSRYNTNTGRLTPDMFEAVFTQMARDLGRA